MISKQHDGHIRVQHPLKTHVKKKKAESLREIIEKGGKVLQKKAALRHMDLKSDEPVD